MHTGRANWTAWSSSVQWQIDRTQGTGSELRWSILIFQSSYFIERMGKETSHSVTFYGQEKTATTIRLAKMNLAVHGLEGDIREANTFYEDVHPIFGKCDFVMANPPFNVDKVDAEKVKDDRVCRSVCLV